MNAPLHPISAERRRLLRWLASAGIALPALPGLSRADLARAPDVGRAPRHLVLVELQGGNDGLNTLVPYTDPHYRAARPNLALGRDGVLALDERVGLHPALEPLMPLWQRGDLAVIEGVGYPAPNRSHFRSIEIWETASASDEVRVDGWLAPLTAALPAAMPAGGPNGVRAVALAADEGPFANSDGRGIVLDDLDRFVQQARRLAVYDVSTDNPALAHVLAVERTTRRAALGFAARLEAEGGTSGSDEPSQRRRLKLEAQLEAIAQLIVGEVGPQVWKVGLGSFDTHVHQLGRHANLLGQLADGIRAFERRLVAAGRWDDVVLMTYSEFGRRLAENGSAGTDHGTAAPQFVAGGAVRGGLAGAPTDLAALDRGDPDYTTDFRSLYQTVSVDWFGAQLAEAPYAGFERLRLFG